MDLSERVEESRRRISAMCCEHRPPKMSIPVRETDDDVFIDDTLQDLTALLAAVDAVLDLRRRDLVCDDEGTYTVDFVEAIDALREASEKVRE